MLKISWKDEPKMWLPGQPLNLPIPQKGDYTENWLKTVSKYDTDLCQGWKGEIDNLLIFVSALVDFQYISSS